MLHLLVNTIAHYLDFVNKKSKNVIKYIEKLQNKDYSYARITKLDFEGEKLEIGVKIKNYLEENGISQAFLSRKTGIDVAKLCLALNGGRRLSLNEYALICGALKLDTNFFLKPRLPNELSVMRGWGGIPPRNYPASIS